VDPCDFGEESVLCAQRLDCDPFEGQECRVEGTHCVPVSNDEDDAWERFSCVPVSTPGPGPGEACALVSDGSWTWGGCAAGGVCMGIDPVTEEGTCAALCVGSFAEPACADAGEACVLWSEEIGLFVCEPTCDPLAGAEACGDGEVCVNMPPAETWACVIDGSGDGGAAGAACEFSNACDPGLACVAPNFIPDCLGEAGCCTTYCDLDAPDCPGGLECQAWNGDEPAPVGHEAVGVCVAA